MRILNSGTLHHPCSAAVPAERLLAKSRRVSLLPRAMNKVCVYTESCLKCCTTTKENKLVVQQLPSKRWNETTSRKTSRTMHITECKSALPDNYFLPIIFPSTIRRPSPSARNRGHTCKCTTNYMEMLPALPRHCEISATLPQPRKTTRDYPKHTLRHSVSI